MTARPDECDVVVLGGGPAGAATAVQLARAGRSVVIIEKSHYEAARIGETLPASARRSLERLGVWDEFLAAGHRPSSAVLSVWGEAEIHDSHSIFNPYGHGWHIDRQRFDTMLAGAASRAGARLYPHAQMSSCRPLGAAGWQLELRSALPDGRRSDLLRAGFVVDATGRTGVWARQQGANRIGDDRLVALVGRLTARARAHAEHECPGSGHDHCTLVEACRDGWWYSALLPAGGAIATYLTDADLLPSRARWSTLWRARLHETIYTRTRLDALEMAAAPTVVAATSSRLDRITGRDWLAVGDAAMAFDPLSSQGLSTALRSALSAADALNASRSGKPEAIRDYDREATKCFREHGRLRAVY